VPLAPWSIARRISALELQAMAAQALTLDAARRHVGKDGVDQARSEWTNSVPSPSASSNGKSWRKAPRSRYGREQRRPQVRSP
jgi:hypothetical protein